MNIINFGNGVIKAGTYTNATNKTQSHPIQAYDYEYSDSFVHVEGKSENDQTNEIAGKKLAEYRKKTSLPLSKPVPLPVIEKARVFETDDDDYSFMPDGTPLPKDKKVLTGTETSFILGNQFRFDLASPTVKDALDLFKDGEEITVGRSGDILVPDRYSAVSNIHLKIRKTPAGLSVRDVSRNGTSIETTRLNENEFLRYKNNDGKPVDKIYLKNSKEARQVLNRAMDSEEYTRDLNSYIDTLNKAHNVLYKGINEDELWYKNEEGNLVERLNPEKTRDSEKTYSVNDRAFGAMIEQTARLFGDSFRIHTGTSKLNLEDIPEKALPLNKGTYHTFPDAMYLGKYFEKMYETACETEELIEQGADKEDILEAAAKHYQYAINANPYEMLNNELFTNELNALLRKANLAPVNECFIDYMALRLQPEAFAKYFSWHYDLIKTD